MRYKNNPANIRYSGFNHWKGLVGNNNGFCEFISLEFGVRALCIVLRRYINGYNLFDVESIISRFAPSTENNTRAYISYVSGFLRRCGCSTNNFKFGSADFCFLVEAICWYETNTPISCERVKDIINMFNLK